MPTIEATSIPTTPDTAIVAKAPVTIGPRRLDVETYRKVREGMRERIRGLTNDHNAIVIATAKERTAWETAGGGGERPAFPSPAMQGGLAVTRFRQRNTLLAFAFIRGRALHTVESGGGLPTARRTTVTATAAHGRYLREFHIESRAENVARVVMAELAKVGAVQPTNAELAKTCAEVHAWMQASLDVFARAAATPFVPAGDA